MKKIYSALVLSGIIGFVYMRTAQAGTGESKKANAMAHVVSSKITIGTIIYNLSDIDGSFRELKENKFTSCQIHYGKGMDAALAQKVKAASEKYNIKVTTVVGVPGRSVWNFKEGPATIGLVPREGRAEKIEAYHHIIDFCVLAGIPAMHSHFGFIPEDPSCEQYEEFIEVMRQLAGYAKDRGIMIYFETGQETPTTLIRALTDIGTGNVFVNCDVANLLLYGKANPTDAIRQFGPLVKDIHAKDGCYPTREDPYHLGVEKPIPEGDVDFPAIIRILKEEGYEGALTIECELNGSNKDYLAKTRQYLQDLLDEK